MFTLTRPPTPAVATRRGPRERATPQGTDGGHPHLLLWAIGYLEAHLTHVGFLDTCGGEELERMYRVHRARRRAEH
jgi:hypothetical protein